MRFRIRVVLVAALAALGAAVPPAQAGSSRLVAFRSCSQLAGYAKSHAAPFVSAYGLGISTPRMMTPGVAQANAAAAAAPQEGVDYSGTNVQETGVDEPDIVKTNGNTLFASEGGKIESVDVSSPVPKLLDTLQVATGYDNQLLLSGTHLLVLSRGGGFVQPLPAMPARMLVPISSNAVLTEVDVSDPSHLQVVKTLTIDGGYLDARMIGTTVRVVTSASVPIELPFANGSKAHNATVLAHAHAAAFIPTYKLGKRAARPLVQCRHVLRPASFSGLGMLTVTTIDLAQGLAPVDSTGIMTDGSIVYASPTTLYVATEQWNARPLPTRPQIAPSDASTQINAFDISAPTKATYLGSTTVPGYLLDQWSLSEFQGILRVVSTDAPAWWGSGPATQSYLTTFSVGAGGLKQKGQLGGLGQGERVYAVRFIGNDAYVVTFKQVDPLHTIDVSDPSNPKKVGELTLAGYSSYLHPISNTLLLGIGQDVGANNEPSGTQVSLFDVSDLAHPKLVTHASLGQGWSAAESDHHAFLYWPQTSLVVVPFGQQAVGMKVTQSGISELGRIVQTQANASSLPQIDRSVVVRDDLLTVSSAGVKASSLSSLADVGWTAFPQPSPTPVNPGGPIVPAPAKR